MIDIKNPSDCSGCTACVSICPKGAIDMVDDGLGFKYPKVDYSKCVKCGSCTIVCAFRRDYSVDLNFDKPYCYAVRHKELYEIETSRSGAAFIALSDYVIENGGVVYGAGYKEHFKIAHKRAATKEERNEFKGSKYVQSDMGEIFQEVKDDLLKGIVVLFSGTPCQTAGLNAFVGKKLRENLILVDIICHGVASPFVWRDYLDYLENKENDTIISLNFRDKRIFGWSGLHKESFLFKHKGLKTYNYIFYNPYLIRKSCSSCVFTNTHRPSDITLGDFWGWQNVVPDFNKDDKGVSLVLCNTKKGFDLFNIVVHSLNVKRVNLKDCMQPNLVSPTPLDARRDDFESDYLQYGFKYVMRKYGDVGLKFYIKRMTSFIRRILKNHLAI
mgnify:FL=1